MTWKDIVWPIASEYPDFLSPAGDIILSGSLDDWKLSGDTTLQTTDLPPGHLRLEASGDRESAAMTLVDGQVLGGELTGIANIQWTGNMGWSAALDVKEVNTGILAWFHQHHAGGGRQRGAVPAQAGHHATWR
jgi:autotransporter translocation and assembly factor TamB